jgi:hypothetical protein
MRDHAAYDLMQFTQNSEGQVVSKKLDTWLFRNKKLIDRFGLGDDFKDLKSAQVAVDYAKDASAQFENSVAKRILGSDPQVAISSALSGKNAGKKATELINMVSHDRAALNGLKNSFADHFVSLAETTARDISNKPTISNAALQRLWKKHNPVINAIYKNDPGSIKALDTMRKAYEIAVRNTKSPIGGGSDTAENLLTEIGKVNALNRYVAIAKGMAKIVTKHGDEKVNDLVTRAIFDPEYAQALIKASKAKDVKDVVAILDGKIVKLADYKKHKLGQAIGAGIAVNQ